MSKLKAYTYDDMLDGDANVAIEYYPKSEADKVIAELKARIAELEEERRWRKFPDEKPKDKQWILVYYGYENNGCRIELRRWDDGCKYDVEFQELYTHWRPLPLEPKEGK